MHTMNAVVLAINAYQHYQGDVEDSFTEMEQVMNDARTHSHNQATDLGKVSNELAKMKKEFTTQTRTLAKESTASREQVSTLKNRLAQTERDLNDAQTQCDPSVSPLSLLQLCSCCSFADVQAAVGQIEEHTCPASQICG